MSSNTECYDVLVVGAGCAGLTTADLLCELGAKVLLVEQGEKLAPGPSTRNGGYVHGGGFHAAVIDDPVRASRTATRCREGLEFYRTNHWSAIYRDAAPVRLLVREETLAQRALQRWESLGIDTKILSQQQIADPTFEFLSNVAVAVEVADLPINYALVYQKLYARIRQRGGSVLTEHQLVSFEERTATLSAGGERKEVLTEQVVYCTGYDTKKLLASNSDRWFKEHGFSLKLWKSHVVQTQRFTRFGYMVVDPGQVSVMPQGDYCVVCQSQEDAQIENPNYEQNANTVQGIIRELKQNYSVPGDAQFRSNACLKPSVHYSEEGARSVDVHVIRLSKTEILALPGKATEAPLMAAEVGMKLQHRLSESINARPGETHVW